MSTWGTAPSIHMSSEFQDADGAVLIRGKELYIILETHEFRPHLGQALPVVLEEAVVDGQHLGCQGEDAVGHEEGQNENVAPFGVAYALFPLDTGGFYGCLHMIFLPWLVYV